MTPLTPKNVYKQFRLMNLLDMSARLGKIEGLAMGLQYVTDLSDSGIAAICEEMEHLAGSVSMQLMSSETFVIDNVDARNLTKIPEEYKVD